MVPEPVTEPAAAPSAELRRVGPGGSMAPDNAFAVALLTLWHRVAQAGGAVGFPSDVERSLVGRAVSPVVDAVKSGRAYALAVARSRHVVGFALLERGTRDRSHTATLSLLMVDPDSRRLGLGADLVGGILRVAADVGIERVVTGVPDGALSAYFSRFGFTEAGRLPGWLRGRSDVDEILLTTLLPPAPTASGEQPGGDVSTTDQTSGRRSTSV